VTTKKIICVKNHTVDNHTKRNGYLLFARF